MTKSLPFQRMVPARNTKLEPSPPVSRSRKSARSRPREQNSASAGSSSGGFRRWPQSGRGSSIWERSRSCTNTAPRSSRHSPPGRNTSTPAAYGERKPMLVERDGREERDGLERLDGEDGRDGREGGASEERRVARDGGAATGCSGADAG